MKLKGLAVKLIQVHSILFKITRFHSNCHAISHTFTKCRPSCATYAGHLQSLSKTGCPNFCNKSLKLRKSGPDPRGLNSSQGPRVVADPTWNSKSESRPRRFEFVNRILSICLPSCVLNRLFGADRIHASSRSVSSSLKTQPQSLRLLLEAASLR